MRRQLLQRAQSWRRALSRRAGPRRTRPTAAIDGGPTTETTAAGIAAESATEAASAIVTVNVTEIARGTVIGTGIEMGDRSSGMTAGTVAETGRGTMSATGDVTGMTDHGTADVKAEAETTGDGAKSSCGCVCIPNNRLQVCSYGKPPKEGKQRNDLPCMNVCHGGRCTQKCTSACLFPRPQLQQF